MNVREVVTQQRYKEQKGNHNLCRQINSNAVIVYRNRMTSTFSYPLLRFKDQTNYRLSKYEWGPKIVHTTPCIPFVQLLFHNHNVQLNGALVFSSSYPPIIFYQG